MFQLISIKGKRKRVKGKGTAFASSRPFVTAVARDLRARGALASAYPNPGCIRQLAPRPEVAGYLTSRFGRPEGTAVIQPRVEARACPSFYPGFVFPATPTLKGLNRFLHAGDATPSGLGSLVMDTQGRRCCANPGLNDHNPVGVAGILPSASVTLPFAIDPLPF